MSWSVLPSPIVSYTVVTVVRGRELLLGRLLGEFGRLLGLG